MRSAELRYLVGTQICGAKIKRRLCLLEPAHDGEHSPRWPIRTLTREERLERELAKARVKCIQRGRHIAHLRLRLAALERRRAWVENYPLFRLEYRIRGARRRLRRYWRIVYHRTILRALGKWPPT